MYGISQLPHTTTTTVLIAFFSFLPTNIRPTNNQVTIPSSRIEPSTALIRPRTMINHPQQARSHILTI